MIISSTYFSLCLWYCASLLFTANVVDFIMGSCCCRVLRRSDCLLFIVILYVSHLFTQKSFHSVGLWHSLYLPNSVRFLPAVSSYLLVWTKR